MNLFKDGSSSSCLGVCGVEDFGGGMKVGFWLESGLSVDIGVGGFIMVGYWNCCFIVSLMGEFGEVCLGCDKMVL